MQKNTIIKFIAGLAVFITASQAAAPVEAQQGLVRSLSAKSSGIAVMDLGVSIGYQQDGEYANNVVIPGEPDTGKTITARIMTNYAYMGIGIAPFADLGISLPIYYDKIDIDDFPSDAGIGDLNVGFKFQLYPLPEQTAIANLGLNISGTIPTGIKEAGLFPRHMALENGFDDSVYSDVSFYSREKGSIRPMLLLTTDIGNANDVFDLKIHLNIGVDISFDSEKANSVPFAFALEYYPVEPLGIFVEYSYAPRFENFSNRWIWGSDPMMITPGLMMNTPAGVYVKFAADLGLISSNKTEFWKHDANNEAKGWEYETEMVPTFGFKADLGWKGFLVPKDDDRDGLKNDEDRCPKQAEDKDGFEDEDGCPDPDNDGDRVADKKDKCPGQKEDIDGFEDDDGCPDPDNDKDGLPDIKDKCPKSAEDFDGIEDTDGCPDTDNDKDGIVDSLDKCINEPEDLDGYEDNDGCPDKDNDKDGIPDIRDKCKNQPETINGIDDTDGCPDEKKVEKKVEVRTSDMPNFQILSGVKFASGSSTMMASSYPSLDPIIKEMLTYPSVEVEIRGHTDSVGKYESNMSLSQRRAESIRLYLIKHGIESHRVKAVGFGPSSPVADNRTAAGRSKNRRIELVRIK